MVEVEWLFAVAPIAVFVVVIVIVVIIADFIVVVIVVVVALVRVVGVACPERGGGGVVLKYWEYKKNCFYARFCGYLSLGFVQNSLSPEENLWVQNLYL